jgi:hypothetical protein
VQPGGAPWPVQSRDGKGPEARYFAGERINIMKPDADQPKAPEAKPGPKPDTKPDAKDDLKSLPMPEVERTLQSSPDGLSQAEAQKRLTQYRILDPADAASVRRFLDGIDEPEKNWKFSLADVHERKYWKHYMQAYEACLNATSTHHAPWYVVPADDKENARLIVSQIVLDSLNALKMAYPKTTAKRRQELKSIRKRL